MAATELNETLLESLPRCASAPSDLKLGTGLGDGLRKSILLTTPRRAPQRRQRAQASLQPLADNRQFAGSSLLKGFDETRLPLHASTSSSAPSPMRELALSGKPQTAPGKLRSVGKPASPLRAAPSTTAAANRSGAPLTIAVTSDEDIDEGTSTMRAEVIRLRKLLHRQACESQKTEQELARVKVDLWQVRAEADELRLKLSNLERIDRTKSSDLLEERRKNDEMSKQVKEMSANLLSLTGSLDGAEGSGLRKRCFKLVQTNTALSVEKRLLQRHKGWAEAKARILQNEVTRVYLGIHDRVKDDAELEQEMQQEFAAPQFPTDEAKIYRLLMPSDYVHQEAVVDFCTHICHTGGKDIHGFLQSSRVFSEAIRNDCLNGLAREFYALWCRSATLPHILRAAERVVHLQDYLAAFESFAAEITSLLGCAHAKIWVVDQFNGRMWSCVREGDGQKTFSLKLPRGKNADLTGQGIATAAYLTQKPVNVADAREDPRFRPLEEAGPDGHAKSIMCVPVTQIIKSGRQPQVRVVLEVVNKLREAHFDPDRDGRILKLLGKISMEVLQVCEKSSGDSLNTKRKEALLNLFNEHIPCNSPATLLSAIERGLHETFLAQAVALHVVVQNATFLVTMNNQKKLSHVGCEGMKGIVGLTAKRMNPTTLLVSEIEGSQYDGSVDLPPLEKTVIHTVPICDGSGCLAVVQFICPERDRTMITGDDPAYHPENTSHFRLLNTLLTFVQNHLDVVAPPKHRVDLLLTPRGAEQVEGEDRERPDKKSVHFTKNEGNESKDGLDPEAAATMIQSRQRGIVARKSTSKMLQALSNQSSRLKEKNQNGSDSPSKRQSLAR
mmetsp:Transcript_99631/g.157690  ORF Transcript_99631/g.157690 Transcript_99631/m.157690 type:complete len:841 (+) Transcript_99631:70-2592(+)